MFPTPRSSFWLSNALLMGVLRPRNNREEAIEIGFQRLDTAGVEAAGAGNAQAVRSGGDRQSAVPCLTPASESRACASEFLPAVRRPASVRSCPGGRSTGLVWGGRPRPPCVRRDESSCDLALDLGAAFGSRRLAGEGVRSTRSCSRSKTICLPMRRTVEMRLCSSAAAISRAEDFSGSGFWPSQIGFDHVAGDTSGQSAGDGFNFGEFRHDSSVYKAHRGSS